MEFKIYPFSTLRELETIFENLQSHKFSLTHPCLFTHAYEISNRMNMRMFNSLISCVRYFR